ncbi:ATP-grasp domain-containing protein [Cellulosimicrobium cellulans]|uniref:ATP-grasp domain-containing protein n=1 Tax=Cellulosimicrobium cellulans TaxID=1710 RepID=UPI0020CDAABB|nr:ATP-grasp domain-containing protein [Cellulosimicrobium cellulans]
MNIILLNKWGLTSLPFASWWGPGAQIFMICSPGAAASVTPETLASTFAEVHVVEDYDSSPEVELLALEIASRLPVHHVVAMSETDILRSARLRGHIGVPGQGLESALAFRDKLVMKEALSCGGVPVARYVGVDDVVDLARARDLLGYPFVLKPRRGSSSVGIDVVGDDDELRQVARHRLSSHDDMPAALLAEEFVPHDLFHVDGLVVCGHEPALWPSRMTNTLGFGAGAVLRSVTLDVSDQAVAPVVALTRSAIDALPTPDVSIVHAEIFHDHRDGRFFLNEIACRLGGGRIKASFKLSFGRDLLEEYCTRLVAESPDAPFHSVPTQQAGFILVPSREGTVAAVPSTGAPEGVAEVRCHVAVGDRIRPAGSSIDAMASATAQAGTSAQVVRVLESVGAWFEDSLVVQDEEVAR